MIVEDTFGNKHIVPNNYDNEEIIVPATQTKVFNGLTPNDLMTKNRPTWNMASTRVNERRAVTLKMNGPTHKPNGLKIGRREKNW